jgi:hypothetical protein
MLLVFAFLIFLYRRTKKIVSPLKAPSKFNPKRYSSSTNKPSKTILFECAPPPLFYTFLSQKNHPHNHNFCCYRFFLEWIFHFGLLRVRALPKVKNLKKILSQNFRYLFFYLLFCFSLSFSKKLLSLKNFKKIS